MSITYLLRLDDACPTMDSEKWSRMERMLDEYGIKPMVGVIPANNDPKQRIDAEDPGFWHKVKAWEAKGWAIALHGYDHCYISADRGINPLWPRSEFAGVALDAQKHKISEGIRILSDHDISPRYFFAPSHTFDSNTLTALRECSDIRIISDTVATRPYVHDDFLFIPQMGGKMRKVHLPGVWTFCLHPSTMTDEGFAHCADFVDKYSDRFGTFQDIGSGQAADRGLLDKTLSSAYFLYRKLRGL